MGDIFDGSKKSAALHTNSYGISPRTSPDQAGPTADNISAALEQHRNRGKAPRLEISAPSFSSPAPSQALVSGSAMSPMQQAQVKLKELQQRVAVRAMSPPSSRDSSPVRLAPTPAANEGNTVTPKPLSAVRYPSPLGLRRSSETAQSPVSPQVKMQDLLSQMEELRKKKLEKDSKKLMEGSSVGIYSSSLYTSSNKDLAVSLPSPPKLDISESNGNGVLESPAWGAASSNSFVSVAADAQRYRSSPRLSLEIAPPSSTGESSVESGTAAPAPAPAPAAQEPSILSSLDLDLLKLDGDRALEAALTATGGPSSTEPKPDASHIHVDTVDVTNKPPVSAPDEVTCHDVCNIFVYNHILGIIIMALCL